MPESHSVGRPRLTAAPAAARVAPSPRPSRSRGYRGVSPCLPGLAERPCPASVASGKAREGRKARGDRSGAEIAPCTPKLWPANSLCNETFDTYSGRAWTRAGHPSSHLGCRSMTLIQLPHAKHAVLCDSVGEKFQALHGVDFISVPTFYYGKN